MGPPPNAPMLTPPPIQQTNPIGDMLDSLTGGHFAAVRNMERAEAMQNYGIASMQRYASSLPPSEQLKFAVDPQGYLAQQRAVALEQAKPLNPKADERVVIPAGANAGTVNAAPGSFTLDPTSGGTVNDMTGATGPTFGGGFGANGLSSRTGQQVPVATYESEAPGAHGGFVAPPLLGLGAASPVAAGPPAGAPRLFPSAQDVTTATGGMITSAQRTPAHNAAVGGVPNSYHLTGQAYDVAPPAGMSMADFTAKTQAAFPGLKVLNEGSHVHIQPMARNAAVPTSGLPSSLSGGTISPPRWNPATNQYEQTGPDGKVTPAGSPPFDPSKMRDAVLGNEDYKQANGALAAYSAMKANSGTLTGPSAYSMLDTFARAINPGAVARSGTIEAIKESLGPFNKLGGQLDSLQSMGNLTPQVRQQLLDSVLGFVKAHYGQAKALNDQNAEIAKRYGMNPQDVTAPLEAMPGAHHVTVPAPSDLVPGDTYQTRRGIATWNGKAFER